MLFIHIREHGVKYGNGRSKSREKVMQKAQGAENQTKISFRANIFIIGSIIFSKNGKMISLASFLVIPMNGFKAKFVY